jgi:hypothetical protein
LQQFIDTCRHWIANGDNQVTVAGDLVRFSASPGARRQSSTLSDNRSISSDCFGSPRMTLTSSGPARSAPAERELFRVSDLQLRLPVDGPSWQDLAPGCTKPDPKF